MGPETLIPFIAIIAFATYVQTVTGFALGMIVMGAVTAFELAPIAFTSVVISAVVLINGVVAIKGSFHELDLKRVAITCVGIFPALLAGLILLEYLSDSFNNMLQLLLGITIFTGGLLIMLRPEPLEKPSPDAVFVVSGVAAGFLAGMFSMAGPPLVYLFYRQPFELKTIRLCLLCIFLISSAGRIIMVGFQGGLSVDMLTFSLICIPMVMFFTWIGKRYPPPLSTTNMRRFAFLLLILIGLSLMIGAL
ncbi:sulfite exporter TauE/SafE family protein [Neptunomonas qingdaonensis]|uniref:Probable membrane transporter protein n=1 Tax=Neptunomonas qingdaonensis TaxID=1045558 RepID=A0A1I2USG9_9GAMM|nr:sulfite exporter TauE/SafE family protein [Neptunomonas qingdaonensis]SFG80000.1 Sulfite exporter TauE/SafE [Neptunomonas qingdaonensis]